MNIFTRTNILTQSLWRDEAFSVLLSERSLLEIIKITAQDFSPPFYYLVLSGWMSLFGNSEVALRSLSLLFFVGTVFFVYLAGRRLFKENVARGAALFTLLNPFLFYYAFEARMYTLFALLVAGSFYFLISERWLVFLFFAFLGLYTHNFMVVALGGAVAAFILIKVWRGSSISPKLFFILGGLGLLYIPWSSVLIRQSLSAKKGFWIEDPSLVDLLRFFGGLVVDGTFVGSWIRIAVGAVVLLAAAFILFKYCRNYVDKSGVVLGLVGGFTLFPVLGVFVVSKTIIPVFVPRYLIFVVIPFVLVLSFLLDKLPFQHVFFGLLVTLFVCLDFRIWSDAQKRDFRRPLEDLSYWWRGEPVICETILNFFQVKYYGRRFLGDTAEIKLLEKGYAGHAGGALVEENELLKTVPASPYFVVAGSNSVKWCTAERCTSLDEL